MRTHFTQLELPSHNTSSDGGWWVAGVLLTVLFALFVIAAWATR